MSAGAKRLVVAWSIVAALAVVHELLAMVLIEERIAGLLLSAGAAAHPVEALAAVGFLALRLTLLPVAGGLLGLSILAAARAAVRRGTSFATQLRRERWPNVSHRAPTGAHSPQEGPSIAK